MSSGKLVKNSVLGQFDHILGSKQSVKEYVHLDL